MKFIHLSDLHIGKRVNEFSMLEDQAYILSKIIEIVDAEKPQGVIIAGDVYDKSVPSGEAIQLFDDFLVRLVKRELKVFVISGNHDSPERIAFGYRLIDRSGVYLSPVYDGSITPISMEDQYGAVKIFMLPFIKPIHIKRFYPEEELESYTEGLRKVIEKLELCPEERNIMITHQFVTGAARCESEEISVGGSDNVDGAVFAPFDYVALGHLHGPQNVWNERIRYCGTPLKYSFSEAKHKKSVTVLEIFEKGNQQVREIPLVPKRDMKEIKGTYMEVTDRNFYKEMNREDYFHVTLTDEEDIPDAVGKLRTVYPNIMKLDYDNTRTRFQGNITGVEDIQRKTPMDLFAEFFEKQNNKPLEENQEIFLTEMIGRIWEERK